MNQSNTSGKSSPPSPKSGSPDRFGYSWSLFTELSALQATQFAGWTSALPESLWPGASFLDVGCGMGRNTVWAMQKGAGPGIAIDVDERSLDTARRNTQQWMDRVDVRWMSAYEIKFTEQFDIVFSIGVIHHLEHPELAVQNMVKATKSGGRVLVWLYGRENNGWIVYLFNPIRRFLFSRLPIGITNGLAWVLAAILLLLLRMGWGRLPYHDLLRKTTFRHIKHITFDHMLPHIALYYRREEAEALLKQAGLVHVRSEWVNEMSWSVCGQKPMNTVLDTCSVSNCVAPGFPETTSLERNPLPVNLGGKTPSHLHES
ncbi:MAG: class I SAM-dependent methyltransferase [Magnetococcales bacterium]|nr:class I SAM-dependent methyltransferase [Magnetococcales bacterium]